MVARFAFPSAGHDGPRHPRLVLGTAQPAIVQALAPVRKLLLARPCGQEFANDFGGSISSCC
jgi:hypothetical protein